MRKKKAPEPKGVPVTTDSKVWREEVIKRLQEGFEEGGKMPDGIALAIIHLADGTSFPIPVPCNTRQVFDAAIFSLRQAVGEKYAVIQELGLLFPATEQQVSEEVYRKGDAAIEEARKTAPKRDIFVLLFEDKKAAEMRRFLWDKKKLTEDPLGPGTITEEHRLSLGLIKKPFDGGGMYG